MNDQTKFLIEERIKTIRESMIGDGMTYETIKTYCSTLRRFFEHIEKIKDISQEEVLTYLDYLMIKKDYIARSRNLVAKIIRYYFKEYLKEKIEIDMAKEDKPIPKVCWDYQFKKIIKVTPNIKHKLILWIMRYSGLRRWEAIRLEKHHILEDGRILVRHGKGKKDRYTIVPPQISPKLKSFIGLLPENNNNYVFQGQGGIGHYSKRTPLEILHNAFKKLKWNKKQYFGCHALRHACCIHWIDDMEYDMDTVSKYLGHSVKQTTQIYTQCRRLKHIENIKKYEEKNCVIL